MKWYIVSTYRGTRLGIVYSGTQLKAEEKLHEHLLEHNPSLLNTWSPDTWITRELECPVIVYLYDLLNEVTDPEEHSI